MKYAKNLKALVVFVSDGPGIIFFTLSHLTGAWALTIKIQERRHS